MDEKDRQIVRQLQADMPLEERPFAVLAESLGITEDEYICRVQQMLEQGVIRRLAAVLRHVEAGYSENAMVVVAAAPEETDRLGERLAEIEEVSHCYARTADEAWPFNLYAMVHGRSLGELEDVLNRVREIAGERPMKVLRSVRELKKTSMRYL